MSGLRKSYSTDTNKEIGGFKYTMDHAKNEDGTIATFVLSRMGRSNPAYLKALNAAMEPHKRKRELGTLSNEVAEKVLLEVFCSTIIKGWENVQNDDGKNMPFTPEAAMELMQELPDLYDELSTEASSLANFRIKREEDEGKLSLTS